MIVIMIEIRGWLCYDLVFFVFFIRLYIVNEWKENKKKKNCWYDHSLCINTSLYTQNEKGEIEISVKTRNRLVDVCRSSYQRHHCSQTPADHVHICSSSLIGSTCSHSLWLREKIASQVLIMDVFNDDCSVSCDTRMEPLMGHDNNRTK